MKRYNKNEIDKLAEILKNDGVISVPTDTVFGVCAHINSINAYNKLIKTKNRPITKPFPIMCADKEQIKEIAIIDIRTEKLIRKFMPGPINGWDTIAVRLATSKALEELIRKTGSPLFMSSANQSGEPTCKNLDEIERCCPNLDGMMEGEISFGIGSTIVDCTSNELKILREGPISIEQIEEELLY